MSQNAQENKKWKRRKKGVGGAKGRGEERGGEQERYAQLEDWERKTTGRREREESKEREEFKKKSITGRERPDQGAVEGFLQEGERVSYLFIYVTPGGIHPV